MYAFLWWVGIPVDKENIVFPVSAFDQIKTRPARRPIGLVAENQTSTQHQAMFSCLGKGNPGAESDSNSAGRRHTLGGSTSAIGRSINPTQSPIHPVSPVRPTQKVPSSWTPQAPFSRGLSISKTLAAYSSYLAN
ncbi:hypothetical protein TSMEX_002585 [Taenia solium]